MLVANPAGPAIEVDYAALATTVARLRALSDELASSRVQLSQMLGDHDLTVALAHAEGDWTRQRRRLLDFLDAAIAGLEDSLRAYHQADGAIARSARPVAAGHGGH